MADLRDFLREKLSERQLGFLRRAFDIVGDVAVVEIPKELEGKRKVIASAVMKMHGNVKAVYVERGGRKGKLRLQKLEWLAGGKRTETVAVENGVRLKLDVAKVYFSPRMASERKRIYEQVKEGEVVLVMFSGAAPYVVEIAKHTKAGCVYGVELNRVAHRYAIENVMLNKVENKTRLFCGDVGRVLPKLGKKFDRIVMPLPKGAHAFLDLALRYVKRNSIINYYDFLPDEEIPKAAVARVEAAAEKLRKKVRIKKVVKCGQLAPRAYRVCVDFVVV
ncbi:class I SAM-dependent methyltransferase family protein [Candidatus Woesearchaeota archaeon]|nr:class I SAM-dependent methyltransferase family protein [Candidatus Woesearchaeota archaeon]